MKKILTTLLVALLITGCTKAPKTITEESLQLLQSGLDKASVMENYTENSVISVELKLKGESAVTTKTISNVQFENQNGVPGLHSTITASISDIGEQTIELWHKDGKVYFNQEGQFTAQEMTYEDCLNEFKESGASTLINSLELIDESETKTGDNVVLKFTLSEVEVKKMMTAIYESLGDVELEMKSGSVTYTIDKNGNIISANAVAQITMGTGDEVADVKVDVTSTISNIDTTVIEYPKDLDKIVTVEPSDTDANALLRETLIEEFNYEVVSTNVLSYDWGSEIYQFDFDKGEFSLITDKNTYIYNWREQTGKSNDACLYNFKESSGDGCSEEDISNLQLAKELFEQECNAAGLTATLIY